MGGLGRVRSVETVSWCVWYILGFPVGSDRKESARNAGDMGLIPGLGRTATHSSILSWRISWTKEPDVLQSMGLQRVRHDWVVTLSLHDISICICIYHMSFSLFTWDDPQTTLFTSDWGINEYHAKLSPEPISSLSIFLGLWKQVIKVCGQLTVVNNHIQGELGRCVSARTKPGMRDSEISSWVLSGVGQGLLRGSRNVLWVRSQGRVATPEPTSQTSQNL